MYFYGYYFGYNFGYNCVEVVNFVLDSWLLMGKIVKRCQCVQVQDSVWVDVYEIERKFCGEEIEYEEIEDEDEDEDDDDGDIELNGGFLSFFYSYGVWVRVLGRKCKRGVNDKDGLERRVKKVCVCVKFYIEFLCCFCFNDIFGVEIMLMDDGCKVYCMCVFYFFEIYIEEVDG